MQSPRNISILHGRYGMNCCGKQRVSKCPLHWLYMSCDNYVMVILLAGVGGDCEEHAGLCYHPSPTWVPARMVSKPFAPTPDWEELTICRPNRWHTMPCIRYPCCRVWCTWWIQSQCSHLEERNLCGWVDWGRGGGLELVQRFCHVLDWLIIMHTRCSAELTKSVQDIVFSMCIMSCQHQCAWSHLLLVVLDDILNHWTSSIIESFATMLDNVSCMLQVITFIAVRIKYFLLVHACMLTFAQVFTLGYWEWKLQSNTSKFKEVQFKWMQTLQALSCLKGTWDVCGYIQVACATKLEAILQVSPLSPLSMSCCNELKRSWWFEPVDRNEAWLEMYLSHTEGDHTLHVLFVTSSCLLRTICTMHDVCRLAVENFVL